MRVCQNGDFQQVVSPRYFIFLICRFFGFLAKPICGEKVTTSDLHQLMKLEGWHFSIFRVLSKPIGGEKSKYVRSTPTGEIRKWQFFDFFIF